MTSFEQDFGVASNVKRKSVRLRWNNNHSGGPTEIKRLSILGFYSMNSEYEFCDDLSQLQYLSLPHDPSVFFDLKINSERIIRKIKNTNEIKLDSVFRWLISHGQEPMNLGGRSPDFVTFRGVLSMIMSTPYEKFERWIVCASKFKGTIYLCRYDTPEKIKYEESKTTREKDMSDWGYKFEQFLLSEQPGGTPNVDIPNNQNEEFCCVFQATIGPYNFVYSAEMDGVNLRNVGPKFAGFGNDSKRLKEMLDDGKAEFVELKTSADASTNDREWQKIRKFKSRKWWAQCQLVGIDKLICGYRDNEGIVRKLDEFSVRKLPQLGRGFWDSNVCMKYLVDFLKLVVEQVSSGCDEQLWMFTWSPKESDHIQVELCDLNSPYSFLHEWVTNGLKSNKRKNEESLEGLAGCSSVKK